MSLVANLLGLGFKPCTPGESDGDFQLQDDLDGQGPFIARWLSSEACPFPERLREPEGT